ncbi:MAG: toprim domain-containing protein [Oligoflexales bacterium]|nr:toprim domain-containing protein [Oligoflexales bacterium]
MKIVDITDRSSCLNEFQDFAKANGYNLPEAPPIGQFYRFPIDSKDTKKSAWCFLYEISIPGEHIPYLYGNIGDWKTGNKTEFKPKCKMKGAEKNLIENAKKEFNERYEIEHQALQEEAKINASQRWEKASVSGESGYFRRKGIVSLPGIRYEKGGIALIPMCNLQGELCGIQTILPNGNKLFEKNISTKGLTFQIGELRSKIYLCEGVATGFSIYEASKEIVFCSFSAANLKISAKLLRDKFPDHPIIICSDNDEWTKGNPGISQVREAAIIGQAQIVIPRFKDKKSKPTDFNDLHKLEGIEEVRVQLTNYEIPCICISGKQCRDIYREIWRALLSDDKFCLSIYLYQDSLIMIKKDGNGCIKFEPIVPEVFFNMLINRIDFVKERKKGLVPTRPDMQMVKTLMHSCPSSLQQIEGIKRAPFVTNEGKIIYKPGFNKELKIFLDSDIGLKIKPIHQKPSPEDIRNAIDVLLNNMLGDFRFENNSSKAHIIGALIQPFARKLIEGPTPIYCIEAPTAGSGKGLLADVISIISTGKANHPTTLPDEESEKRKKITSILFESPDTILLDNIPTDKMLDSSSLASVITSRYWSDRILGSNRLMSFRNDATWIITGNNPLFSFELSRRVVRIRIDPDHECPWERKDFTHPDLRKWILENRSDLIHAILTLISNWIAKGKPDSSKTLGSFESWSSVIGGILEAAGIAGFLEDLNHDDELADMATEELLEFVEEWWLWYKNQEVTVTDLFRMCSDLNLMNTIIGTQSKKSSVIKLGLELKNKRGRIFKGYKINYVPKKSTHHGQKYFLSEITQEKRENESKLSIKYGDDGQVGYDKDAVEKIKSENVSPEESPWNDLDSDLFSEPPLELPQQSQLPQKHTSKEIEYPNIIKE